MRNQVGEGLGLFDMIRFCVGGVWGGETVNQHSRDAGIVWY